MSEEETILESGEEPDEQISTDGIPMIGPMTVSTAEKQPDIPELLPILPIRDTVVFPGTIIPLAVGRDKSKRLLEHVMTGGKIMGVVAQRNASGYFAMIRRAMSICSSCTRAYPESPISPGM